MDSARKLKIILFLIKSLLLFNNLKDSFLSITAFPNETNTNISKIDFLSIVVDRETNKANQALLLISKGLEIAEINRFLIL